MDKIEKMFSTEFFEVNRLKLIWVHISCVKNSYFIKDNSRFTVFGLLGVLSTSTSAVDEVGFELLKLVIVLKEKLELRLC